MEVATGLSAQIKWPNDVMLGRRKVAGILAEMRGVDAVVGIGLNVNQTRAQLPTDTRTAAASLRTVTGHEHDRDAILETLLVRLDRYYRAWSLQGLGDAYCDELERTAIGPFRLEDAPLADTADPASALVVLRDALAFMPERPLSAEEAAAIRHGRRVPAPPPDAHGNVTGHLRLTRDGEIVAIGEVSGGGQVQPVVVFSPA